MSRMTPPIELSDEDYQTLLGWTRSGTTEHRMAFRARIILAAFRGQVVMDRWGVGKPVAQVLSLVEDYVDTIPSVQDRLLPATKSLRELATSTGEKLVHRCDL